jgi:23S rRNA (cytidine1920-2'-O)/16S rRNA (cytidine1409-2'-O)-methyltransferase
MDLSFISVLKVLPALKGILGAGTLIALIKPQFEVGKGQVGRGGIVRSPEMHADVLDKILQRASDMSFFVRGIMRTSVLGQKGNREFFVHWSLHGDALTREQACKSIKEAVWDG